MVTVKKPSEPTAPPAHGEAPPPEYGQPPSSAYSQLPPPQPPTGIPMQPSVPTKPPAHGEAPAPPQEYGQPPSSAYSQPPPPPPPTGVPMQPSPSLLQVQGNLPGPWSTGLCDCFSDVSNCCITCWCPCITFGQIAEIVDRGSTSCGASGALYGLISCFTGCACIYSCFYRSRMRSQYMLAEEPCPDLLLHLCCESCALCQEYRELQHRGFDMNLGWYGNVDKLNQGLTMAPFVEGGMNR